jgi:hypothetical protein
LEYTRLTDVLISYFVFLLPLRPQNLGFDINMGTLFQKSVEVKQAVENDVHVVDVSSPAA